MRNAHFNTLYWHTHVRAGDLPHRLRPLDEIVEAMKAKPSDVKSYLWVRARAWVQTKPKPLRTGPLSQRLRPPGQTARVEIMAEEPFGKLICSAVLTFEIVYKRSKIHTFDGCGVRTHALTDWSQRLRPLGQTVTESNTLRRAKML